MRVLNVGVQVLLCVVLFDFTTSNETIKNLHFDSDTMVINTVYDYLSEGVCWENRGTFESEGYRNQPDGRDLLCWWWRTLLWALAPSHMYQILHRISPKQWVILLLVSLFPQARINKSILDKGSGNWPLPHHEKVTVIYQYPPRCRLTCPFFIFSHPVCCFHRKAPGNGGIA